MLFQFKSSPESISDLEIELKRDERIMRFLTIKLDKHAMAYAERRRSNLKSKEKVK